MSKICEMAAKTDVGRQRFRNEDNFLILEKFSIAAVADGMGGHVDGDIASQIAVDTIKDRYENLYPKEVEPYLADPEKLLKKQEEFLLNTIHQANDNIFNKNKGTFSLEGMGTTVVVLQIVPGYCISACVGDSRIYRLREENLSQVTQDHSLVGELVRYNIIGERDILFWQNKNIITRALGMTQKVTVDTCIQQIKTNDIFLLCTDGLTDLVSDAKIKKTLESEETLESMVSSLVDQANEAGGQDNITAALVKVLMDSETAQ